MACLLSTTFTIPLPMVLLNKGVHHLDSAVVTPSNKTAICTAQKSLGSCNSNKLVLSVKGCCQHCLMSLDETFCNDLDVDCCTEIVISGYWVGPDADDGWGFVEAVINQMT
ncbi:uncharacterized protein LOC130717884 [Lotus japonicus]|uniref:uncharacterized protein LOC130717884 n=1 Tax=Lotus japonicus TaxID=34305 RepID=UPI002583A6FD|nr:uncharacterized protein LOC130717884 [Lotus japonicus]